MSIILESYLNRYFRRSDFAFSKLRFIITYLHIIETRIIAINCPNYWKKCSNRNHYSNSRHFPSLLWTLTSNWCYPMNTLR